MQVDASQPRQVQHPSRNDAPVSDYQDGIRTHLFQPLAKFHIVFDLVGLRDRNSVRRCGALHRRSVDLQVASGGAIRLRHRQGNLVPRGDHRLQRRYRELRRATKNQPQTTHPEKQPLASSRQLKEGLNTY
jgi:hypothetical protein